MLFSAKKTPSLALTLLLFLFPLLLVGCSQQVTPTHYNELVWRGQREKLEQLTHWELSGKMAIFTAQQKGSARVHWQQDGDDYHLVLTTLIGTTLLDLNHKAGKTVIIDSDGKSHEGEDPEALVQALTGWPIPIRQLPLWIKGLPGDAHFTLGEDGRISELSEGAWQLRYHDYALTRLWLLPTAMDFTGPQTRLKLVINEWNIRS